MMKVQNGTSNWWLLYAGGRYSEVVRSLTCLTVRPNAYFVPLSFQMSVSSCHLLSLGLMVSHVTEVPNRLERSNL